MSAIDAWPLVGGVVISGAGGRTELRGAAASGALAAGVASAAGVAPVGGPIEMGDHGTGIGLRKDDVALKASIDSAIAGMRADGTYQKIARKYFDFDVYGN